MMQGLHIMLWLCRRGGPGPAHAYASETAAAVTLARDPAGPVRLRIRARAVRLTCDPGIVLAETAHSITLDL